MIKKLDTLISKLTAHLKRHPKTTILLSTESGVVWEVHCTDTENELIHLASQAYFSFKTKRKNKRLIHMLQHHVKDNIQSIIMMYGDKTRTL